MRSKKVKRPVKKVAKKAAKKRADSIHTDKNSHNVKIKVISGYKGTVRKGRNTTVKYTRIAGLPQYQDKELAEDLKDWAENDSQLYFSQRRPILINLGKKYQKGTFDVNKAAKLFRYFIDNALKKYNKEHGSKGDKWYELLSVYDRQLLALEMADEARQEFEYGNFTN